MDNTLRSARDMVARLAAALQSEDDLSHEVVEEQLPALIEAELAGESVDSDPRYAALLRHLDHCAACLALYERLAADVQAVVGEEESLPQLAAAPPPFFPAPIPKGEHVLLEVLRGVLRRFTLTFDLPRLAPTLATLSGPQRVLFSDTLAEVSGTPLLALTAGRGDDGVWIQVAVREPGQKTTWRLTLDAGSHTQTATTDARGVARFTLPADIVLGEVRLRCEELSAAEDQ